VGNNSLAFIAMMARRGWSDKAIRTMYDRALYSSNIISPREEKWLEVEEWYINGNRTSPERARDSDAGS
jgi:hypothetical protein